RENQSGSHLPSHPNATSRHPDPPDRTQQHRPAPAINPSPSAAPAAVWSRRKLLENAAVLADFPTSVSPSSGHQISRTMVLTEPQEGPSKGLASSDQQGDSAEFSAEV
ncbi:hypothetical protein Prudu_000792, partial [Prunus dulcis]